MSDHREQHIVAIEAMRFLDGDMTSTEMQRVQQHVDICSGCEALLASTRDHLGSMSEIFTQETRRYDDTQATAIHRMHMKLSEVPDKPGWISQAMLTGKRSFSLRYALVAVTVTLLVGAVGFWQYSQYGETTIAELPNRTLTPGMVREVGLEELCGAQESGDDLDPIVQPSTEKVVFQEYGISTDKTKKSFQVDYLINPQLGGVDDVRNLWPQPYEATEWNAKAKDLLERHLHQMVCERRIELADAQREIAENWIDAYKKYFHTSKPI